MGIRCARRAKLARWVHLQWEQRREGSCLVRSALDSQTQAGHPTARASAGMAPRRPNRFFKQHTRTHEVALKAPNQLGIYDMSGNVFEWCQDICTDDLTLTPADGSPYLGPGDERRLRGGCHQNWHLFCTVSWRYGIEPDAHDHCLGFRVVLARS